MKTRIQLAYVPPSVNHIYRFTRNKRTGIVHCYKTEEYTTWANAVGHFVNRQKAGQPTWDKPVYLTVAIARPTKLRDLDNCAKALGDLLQDHGIIANDKLIHGWNIFWSDSLPPGIAVEIAITAAEPPAALRGKAA